MPAYYRGVDPVIDHDHGNMPGLAGHSEAKPKLPPIDRMELCDPHHHGVNHEHEAAPLPRAAEPEPPHPIFQSRLPAGTCNATLAPLSELSQWNTWCDENCGASESDLAPPAGQHEPKADGQEDEDVTMMREENA